MVLVQRWAHDVTLLQVKRLRVRSHVSFVVPHVKATIRAAIVVITDTPSVRGILCLTRLSRTRIEGVLVGLLGLRCGVSGCTPFTCHGRLPHTKHSAVQQCSAVQCSAVQVGNTHADPTKFKNKPQGQCVPDDVRASWLAVGAVVNRAGGPTLGRTASTPPKRQTYVT